MNIDILWSPDCGCDPIKVMGLVSRVVVANGRSAEIRTIIVHSTEQALRVRYEGSPSIRVNGVDVDPNPPRNTAFG